MQTAYRKEYKYYLPVSLVADFRKAIQARVVIDHYASKKSSNSYTVRSIYYDTPNLRFYHDKIEGICNRKKVRIRVYNDFKENSSAFLEIKRKYENSQIKNRAKILFDDLEEFLIKRDTGKYISNKLNGHENATRFLYLMARLSLQPKSLVVYEREPFFYKFDSTTRITIDHNLRKADRPGLNNIYSEDILTPLMHDSVILEIKFYKGYSSWIQKVVEEFGLTRTAISKYALAIEGRKSKRLNKARIKSFNNHI